MVRAGVAFVLALMAICGPVFAEESAAVSLKSRFELPKHDQANAAPTGKALLPYGYVDFCGRGEEECKFTGGKEEKLKLNASTWDEIEQVNHSVNTSIRADTDMNLFHVVDYWTYPVDAGDCEDFVLLKKRQLVALGVNADELLITVVIDENGDGHAVLTVITDAGDYVLDNRRDEILRWDDTGYRFVKRQSQQTARDWVTLQPRRIGDPILVSTKTQ